MTLPAPHLADRYEVVRTLGHGRSTVVYAARDALLGEEVAVKAVVAGPERAVAQGRLRAYVRAARRISHPNVCRVHDLHESDDAAFLVMELLDGRPLASLGDLPRTLDVIRQIGAGLSAAHRAGVVHRDLVPRHVIVGAERVVLTGFGEAGVLGVDGTPEERQQDVAGFAGIVRTLLAGVGGLADAARSQLDAVVARAEAGGAESVDAVVTGVLAAVRGPVPRSSRTTGELLAPGLRDKGTRRLATVVHVAVTARGEDEDEIHEQREGLLFAAEAALTDTGGVIVARSPHSLTAVLGAKTSTADEPVRAADASRAVVDAAASAREIAVRVGIDAGRLLVKEGTGLSVSGDAVREAQRLAEAAAPGEVHASWRAARPLAARFRLEPPRGPTVRVLPRLPVDALGPGLQLFGRERELARVVGAVAPAREGRPQAMLVVGPPGIGKSRLRREIVETLRTRAGFRVLHTNTRPDDVLVSFGVVRALLEALDAPLEVAGAPGRVAALAKQAFAAAAAKQPLAIVVDDVHWSDDASLGVLAALAAGEVEAPIATLLFGRPEAQERRSWPAAMAVLELGPLAADQSLNVVAAILGEKIDPERAREIVAAADGNPFFIEELARDFLERGATPGSAPSSIEQTIQARLDRLPEDARLVLRAAAVLGRRFERADLERVLADIAPRADLHMILDQLLALLERRQLMFPIPPDPGGEERMLIKHALVRDVAYAELGPTARRALHGAAARVLGAQVEDSPSVELLVSLAGHLEGAEERARAAATWERAGRRAREASAFVEAQQCLQRAATLHGDQAPFDLLLELGEVTREVGGMAEAEASLRRALELATQLGLASERAMALLGLGKLESLRGNWDASEACFREGLAATDEETQPRLAGCLHRDLGWCRGYGAGDTVVGEAEARRGVELLEGTEHREDLGRAYDCVAAVALRAGNWREQLAWNLKNLALSEELGGVPLFVAQVNVGENYRNLGNLVEAEGHTRAALRMGEKLLMPRNRAYCMKNLALFAVDRGALDEAERCLAEVRRLESIVGPAYWHIEVDFITARVAARRGDLAAARRSVGDGLARAEAAKSAPDLGIGRKYQAEVLSLGGETDAALAALDEAERVLEGADRGELARAWATRVRVLARAGKPDPELRSRAAAALERLGASLDLAALDDPTYV